MEDKNDNMIPDNWDRYASKAVAIIAGLLALAINAKWGGEGAAVYLTNALAVLAVLGNLMKWGTYSPPGRVEPKVPKGPSSLLVLVLLGAVASAGCPGKYDAAWKSTAGVMRATQSAAKGLASIDKASHETCLKQHGPQTKAYAGCIQAASKRLIVWRDVIRPAARSSVAAAYAAIRIAEKAGNKEVDYMKYLADGGCALIRGLREWGHMLPDKGASVLPLLEAFQGAVCDRPKSAAGVVAILSVILPVAVDIAKWVVELIGASNDDLQKEINSWLNAVASDEVDAVLAQMGAAMPQE